MDDEILTGKDLIDLGYTPGPVFSEVLREARERKLSRSQALKMAQERQAQAVAAEAQARSRRMMLRDAPLPYQSNITADHPDEEQNVAAVRASFDELMRTPTIEAGAIMPDACPAGPPGTIPVGGVVAARDAIHPGMHSADICCSLTASFYDDLAPGALLNAIHGVTHFGPGGRPRADEIPLPKELREAIRDHELLRGNAKLQQMVQSHFGTQGDGNHFAFVGRSKATGQVALVTHHGSRGFGALLYKIGMDIAERFRREIAPDTLPANAWIPASSREGALYWQALELLREWTRLNHAALHDAASRLLRAKVADRLWNPHNFVFREADGDPRGDLFWHAKGATPIHDPLQHDTTGTQIVPLNMAQPVLLVRGERNARNLGFAPHGAGRNMSRTQHRRRMAGRTDAEIFAQETKGLDVRFHSRRVDISELPSAYKDADSVRADMARFDLARVVDEIAPYGSIMAGDWQADAPWKRKAAARRARWERATVEPQADSVG